MVRHGNGLAGIQVVAVDAVRPAGPLRHFVRQRKGGTGMPSESTGTSPSGIPADPKTMSELGCGSTLNDFV